MSDGQSIGENTSLVILNHLRASGFIQNIERIRENLTIIARDLEILRQSAARREQEAQAISARVLALEAILSVALRCQDIDIGAVRQVIRTRSDGGGAEVGTLAEALAGSLIMSTRN